MLLKLPPDRILGSFKGSRKGYLLFSRARNLRPTGWTKCSFISHEAENNRIMSCTRVAWGLGPHLDVVVGQVLFYVVHGEERGVRENLQRQQAQPSLSDRVKEQTADLQRIDDVVPTPPPVVIQKPHTLKSAMSACDALLCFASSE